MSSSGQNRRIVGATVLPSALLAVLLVVAAAQVQSGCPASPTCEDGEKNGLETDVDCGGGACARCPAGKKCREAEHCLSEVCEVGVCREASCADDVQNGDETDVDCGGACAACGGGLRCKGPGDCAAGICKDGRCPDPSCTDGLKNGDEGDVDCGGECPNRCVIGKRCQGDDDCESGYCTGSPKACAASSCADKLRNGDESDVDCGGEVCAPCGLDQKCRGAADCASNSCTNLVCVKPSCTNQAQDGKETGIDCGGPCSNEPLPAECANLCAKCGAGQGCQVPDDCKSIQCINNLCS